MNQSVLLEALIVTCPPHFFTNNKFRISRFFSRIFRYITGESVGIVLGGGGARGLSHIGMIKSTLEAGIPIDHVAGVSIGALIGGLYAVERDLREVTLKARSFSTRFAQQWR